MSRNSSNRAMSQIEAARHSLLESASRRGLNGEGSDDLTYWPSILCQLSLPSRSQPGSEYRRVSGKYAISILTPEEFGIPYGCWPRGILAYIAQRVKFNQSRSMEDPRLVELGANIGDFLGSITGTKNRTGGERGNLTIFERQFRSLVNSTINYSEKGRAEFAENAKAGDELIIRGGKYDFAKRYEERRVFQPHLLDGAGNAQPFSRSKIMLYLGEDFYNDLLTRAVPLQAPVLRALWPSSLQIDVYSWLTYRANSAPGKIINMTWAQIRQQFGGDYSAGSSRSFKQHFKKAFDVVREVYDPSDRDCIRITEDPKTQAVTISAKRPSVAREEDFTTGRGTSYPATRRKPLAPADQSNLFAPAPEAPQLQVAPDWLRKFEFHTGRKVVPADYSTIQQLHDSDVPIMQIVEAYLEAVKAKEQ